MSRGARIVIGVVLALALLALIVQVFLKPTVRYTGRGPHGITMGNAACPRSYTM